MNDRGARVWITGVGVIGPLGLDPIAMSAALAEGKTGIGRPRLLPREGPVRVTAEARGFDGKIDGFGPLPAAKKKAIRKGLKVMCREIQMGVAAAQRALADAGLDNGQYDPDRIGMVFGSDYILTVPEEIESAVRACVDEHGSFDFQKWGTAAIAKIAPLWLLKYLPNMPASHVAIYNDLRGPNNSITVREASSLMAIAEASAIIARGDADVMLAGATGTRVHPLRSLHAAMQEEVVQDAEDPASASRPFDVSRRGSVLGEGAAVLVLERAESAAARGAAAWGEVLACGLASRATGSHETRRHAALRDALACAVGRSGVPAGEMSHYQAQGLATPTGDVAESRAIRDIFGEKPKIPVTAISSYCGNVGAASGLMQVIAGLLALREKRVFAVAGHDVLDPQCRPLEVVSSPRSLPASPFATASATFQGQAAAAVIGPWEMAERNAG